MSLIDKYNLHASTSSTIVGTEELEKDLELTTSLISLVSIIQGVVLSALTPVEGATVKLFALNGTPLFHAVTGADGRYVLPEIPAGSYLVTVAKEGYLTPIALPAIVVAHIPTIVNLALVPDPDAALNTIYGKIKSDAPLLEPLHDATVNLYQFINEERTLIASTKTNEDGQYIFPYIADSNYVVEAIKENYLTKETTGVNVAGTEKLSVNLTLTPLASANFGTVSGFITDAVTKLPIVNAVVALYQIIDGEEVLIQQTKTNLNGGYLFGDVPGGTFLVKSFVQTELI